MKDRFDLEQHIMDCWNVTSDVQMLLEAILDSPRFDKMPAEYSDSIANMLLGVKELYEMRFERLWSTFEDCITTEFSPEDVDCTAPQHFVCGEGGDRNENGLPESIFICPALGSDITVKYTRVD